MCEPTSLMLVVGYGKRTPQILGCISSVRLVASVAQAGVVAETTPFVGTDGTTWNIGPNGNNLGQCIGIVNVCSLVPIHQVITSGNTSQISFSQNPGGQDADHR